MDPRSPDRRQILRMAPLVVLAAGGAGATDPRAEADALLARMAERWTGDLDGVLKRGFLRVAVAYGPPFFVADGPRTSGLTVDLMREFEAHLRDTLGSEARALTLVLVLAPLPRDAMLPLLRQGAVDLVAASLTITPDRRAEVDFTDPLATDVRELVATGPAAPPVARLADLHRLPIHVRASSSHHEHLSAIDAARRAAGLSPMTLVEADPGLSDADLLEMVSLGVMPATVADDFQARLFAGVFDGLTVREDLPVNDNGAIACALRKDSPGLMAAANGFVSHARRGTLLGNVLIERHYGDADRMKRVLDEDATSRFAAVIGLIREVAARYDFDPLMIAAQGFQESQLRQSARSRAGAVGIMQVLPSTARDPAIGIPDIETPARNIEAGVKYLRLLRETYLDDPAIAGDDRTLMAFAAYNAGPGGLRKARRRAGEQGLDPAVWFGNVEIAMAQAVSREPVVYVRNILKYYVAYRLSELEIARRGG